MNLPNRTSTNRVIFVLAAGVWLAASAGVCSARTAWWDAHWQYRRAVKLPVMAAPAKTRRTGKAKALRSPAIKAEGDEIAWTTIPTGGLCKPDGSDIRVANGTRDEVPCDVLMVGPGDFAKVAFAVDARTGPAGQYYVYFGNAKPARPARQLEIRRGVLMETKRYKGKGATVLVTARKAFEDSKKLLGRKFVPNIFMGHNPFGPQRDIVTRYTGWLICPSGGIYQFASSSQDASFVLIDGEQVVANGGWHLPQRNISRRGSAKLTAGVHKLTFYHVNTTGDPVAVAAWQPPGGLRIWTIPPESFLPVTACTAGPMEQYGKAATVSFMAEHAGEAFVGGRYYQRWTFKADLASPLLAAKGEYKWDFGDGQHGAGETVDHVYFVTGEHEVTLTARRGGAELTYRNGIYNTRPWDRVASSKLDLISTQAKLVAGYDFAALSPEANAHAVLLLRAAGNREVMAKACLALLTRDAAPSDLLINEATTTAAEALPAAQRANAYLRAEKLSQSAGTRAEMAELAGQSMLNDQADPNGAMAVFKRIVRDYGVVRDLRAVRAARIGIGDAWRVIGKLDEARKAYLAAGLGPDVDAKRLEITKGDYARHVEAYLDRNYFDDADTYIEKWAWDIPADKLEGYWSLLVVKKCLAQKHFADAAREAETLVKVNPRSNYAAELLKLASEAYTKLGDASAAAGALRRIVEQYPESPLAAEKKKQ